MIELGLEIQATIVEELLNYERPKRRKPVVPATFWRLESDLLPPDWKANLRSITGRLYEIGDRDTFWIWAVDQKNALCFVSDSNFGRLPPSDRMRPRYIQALRSFLEILETPDNQLPEVKSQDLSEAAGMLSRCARKDQWDWFSVWTALGNLDNPTLWKAIDTLKRLRSGIERNDFGSIHSESARVRDYLSKEIIIGGLEKIMISIPPLSDAMIFRRTDSAPSADEPEKDNDPYVVSQAATKKLERANEIHKKLLQIWLGSWSQTDMLPNKAG